MTIDAALRPRVLLVGRGAPEQGGIAVYLDSLLSGPLARDAELTLLNLSPESGPSRGGAFTVANARRTVADGWRVFRQARDVDLVHIHSSLGATSTTLRAGWLAWCARRRGRPVLLHAHGGKVISWLESARSRRVLRIGLRPFVEVIAVSDRVAGALRAACDRPVTVVPNGIDLRPFELVADTEPSVPPRVMYVGHLSRRKGVVDLRDASRLLHRRGIEHEVVVVGGVPDEGADEGARVSDEISDDVIMLGRVDHDEIPAILGSASIFCLPSWWEAMPLSVIEAMAAGRAVVASDVGDISLMVDDGNTGLLVPPRNPVVLADALESLLVDAERRDRYGRAGRRRAVELFDGADMVSRLLDRYRVLTMAGRSESEGRRAR